LADRRVAAAWLAFQLTRAVYDTCGDLADFLRVSYRRIADVDRAGIRAGAGMLGCSNSRNAVRSFQCTRCELGCGA
jgi:hypothetical protein